MTDSDQLAQWRASAYCNTCGNQGVVGVAAMPGVPASFAYCANCLAANAHPYGIVVTNTAMLGVYPGVDAAKDWRVGVADWWVEIVESTLAHLGKTEEQFVADVVGAYLDLETM